MCETTASLISKFYLITRSHKGWSHCCNISQLPLPNLMGCVVPFHQACDPNTTTHEQIPIPPETQFGSAMGSSSQMTALPQSEFSIEMSPGLTALALPHRIRMGRCKQTQAPLAMLFPDPHHRQHSWGDAFVSHLENLFHWGFQRTEPFHSS